MNIGSGAVLKIYTIKQPETITTTTTIYSETNKDPEHHIGNIKGEKMKLFKQNIISARLTQSEMERINRNQPHINYTLQLYGMKYS